MKVGFVFIGFNQYVELEITLHQLRYHWKVFNKAPVSVVLSGDPDFNFNDKDASVCNRVPNIVKRPDVDLIPYFISSTLSIRPGAGKGCYREPACNWVDEVPSSSMFRNYQVGLDALNFIETDLDAVVITESNILLLNEQSLLMVIKKMLSENKVAALQTVHIEGFQKGNCWYIGKGTDILPQLMIFDWSFMKRTDLLFSYNNTFPHCMEASLGDNVMMALGKDGKDFSHILVGPERGQWDVHANKEWVHFAHLDKKPGARDDSAQHRWGSREEQLLYEKEILRQRGIVCLEGPPCHE